MTILSKARQVDFSPLLASQAFISLMSITLSPLTGRVLLGDDHPDAGVDRVGAAGEHLVDGLLVLLDERLEQPDAAVAHLVGVLADGGVDLARGDVLRRPARRGRR